jgi:hypothetical protein
MGTAFLTQLAHQLRIGKIPCLRRAMSRTLEELKKNIVTAESAFNEFVESERSCQKTRAS